MGNSSSSSSSSSWGDARSWVGSALPCTKPKYKLLIQGLDASGKTTLLYQLKLGEPVKTIPTIGFNVETIKFQNKELVTWDVGGRDKIRPLLRHYYPGTEGVLFLVDSNDPDRMQHAMDEFYRLITDEHLKNIPVLLLCNKQDLPKAWSPAQVQEYFQIGPNNKTTERVKVMGCSVLKADGIWEGLEWLVEAVETGTIPDEDEASATSEEEGSDDVSQVEPSAEEDWERALGYDPTRLHNDTLKRFHPIRQASACPFAKAAKLWGGKSKASSWSESKEDLARSHAKALTKFVRSCDTQRLDGFCIELEDLRAQQAKDPEKLGQCVKEMLTLLSDLDPAKEHVMDVVYIGSRGWRFRFDRMDFFVTCFAPCYPQTSSRFAFDTGRAFLLFQPETSFLRHDLPADTPQAHWDNPQTIRDKTRIAFRNAGQSYHIPDTTSYPVAEHIVKPLVDNGVNVVRWWE